MAEKKILTIHLTDEWYQKIASGEKTEEYRELQSSAVAAAKRGYVDDIIEPDATRKRLIAAFEMLYGKKQFRDEKKHSAI